MRPVITAETSAALDAASSAPVEVLMDRAGRAVALVATRMGATYGTKAVVLAGPGNNGGDGYVAAAYLAERGVGVTVEAWAEPKTPACRAAAEQARRAGVRVVAWTGVVRSADLVIDALFGGGFHGILPDAISPWLDQSAPVLSVDVPSGLGATTGSVEGRAFEADVTVTFHAAKVGHYVGDGPALVGRLEVVDIGLEGGAPAFLVCEDADAPRVRRKWDAHKWTSGSVMVVGGVMGMTGAALMAARAALRFGAGAVSIATLASTQSTYATLAPELLTTQVGSGRGYEPGDAGPLLEQADRFDVLVLGPGLGPEHRGFVDQVVRRRPGKLLVDADGLNALEGLGSLQKRGGETIITPHAGELARLVGRVATHEVALEVALDIGGTVVLKGWPTFVASGESLVAVTSGGPELATIGTGDILAGMIGAGWAAGLAGPVAARAGAHWHGRLGAKVAATETVTADRLLSHVGSLNP